MKTNFQPPQHGQMKRGGQMPMTKAAMQEHMANHEEHTNATADYGGHGVGDNSRGEFSQGGGASDADYTTTSTGGTTDEGGDNP